MDGMASKEVGVEEDFLRWEGTSKAIGGRRKRSEKDEGGEVQRRGRWMLEDEASRDSSRSFSTRTTTGSSLAFSLFLFLAILSVLSVYLMKPKQTI